MPTKKQPDPSIDPLVDELPSRYVIGIDLGTTNSAVMWIDTEEIPWQIRGFDIPQRVAYGETESRQTLPSFHYQPPPTTDASGVLMDWELGNEKKKKQAQRVLASVGAWARDEMVRAPGRGIASAKSWLCHAAVDRHSALLPWQAATDVKRLSPVDVSSRFLNHIARAWDHQFPDYRLADQDVVLTLPASFDEVARELTIQAAAGAGLERVVLIEEPQAAFYAWVYRHEGTRAADQDAHWQSKVSAGERILICDIGGGTTDLTLIHVKEADQKSQTNPTGERRDDLVEPAEGDGVDAASKKTAQRIQFHRVAVGNHLILGGDNLDLAIAKHVENRLTSGQQLAPKQWEVLLGSSRKVKEQMLSPDAPESVSMSLPGMGSKLISGSLQAEVARDEIQSLIFEGFLPAVGVEERPNFASGFQEFGLPYAHDPGITRYLADFLMAHATAGRDAQDFQRAQNDRRVKEDLAAPDIVLFNGGFFASELLRDRLVKQIGDWFRPTRGETWSPRVLENDRLDLAVAQGAAYYAMVRREEGVRIAASLARSYYIGIGDGQAICIMPGSAEPGQVFVLDDQTFMLTINQMVEFSIFVSSVRLADAVGQIVPIDHQQLKALPPIGTVLKVKSKNEKRAVEVKLKVGLTEIGTIDLSCHQQDQDRSWKLQFDVRSTTQTDLQAHQSAGEGQGFVDEATWGQCQEAIQRVFVKDHPDPLKPGKLIETLADLLDADRSQWPMSVLRRIWETLMDCRQGRRKSAAHEARWLNLLGYSLRPGYAIALDDWRVTETWRHVRGNLVHPVANIQTESLILWRRLAGGLTKGQQSAIAQPLMASVRAMAKQMSGKVVKGSAVALKPEESVEVWRLLASLELLPVTDKVELGDLIVALKDKKRLASARGAMVWALGRLGQRKPMYGPMNLVVPAENVEPWIDCLMTMYGVQAGSSVGAAAKDLERLVFPVVQIAHRTGNRYNDIADARRAKVVSWLGGIDADENFVSLVRDGGDYAAEQQSQAFGETLPPGLRLI